MEKIDLFHYEHEATAKGYQHIVGVDEVGRGPYAGPVVAAAVYLPPNIENEIPGLNDSKKLTAKRREILAELLHNHPKVEISIQELSHEIVDEINILQATYRAMRLAVKSLMPKADYILVDGNPVPDLPLPNLNIVKGDSKSASIAAASIVAKVYRDKLMAEADLKYPGYDFSKNMGYGTKSHRDGLDKIGPCPIHRKSFKPIAKLLGLPPYNQTQPELF